MKFLYWLVTVLAAAACAVFAVSNRSVVPVSLWPVADTISLPLFALTLGTLLVGLFVGAVIAWLRGYPVARERRRLARRVKALEVELQQSRASSAVVSTPSAVTVLPVGH